MGRDIVFTVELDGETIACSSPWCIARLLQRGWRLADPFQSDALMEALAALELDPTFEPEGERSPWHRLHFKKYSLHAMPVSWRIADGVVFLESTESATFEEWREAVEGFLAHRDYEPGAAVVHDWRQLGSAPPASEIRARADYLVRRVSPSGPMRWALVVTGDANYGMGRMAQGLTDASPIELRVFRDLAEAEAWVRRR